MFSRTAPPAVFAALALTFALALITDGDPTMQYGIDTIQGLTAALLG